MSNASEDRDLLAAEFALGALERHEARAIEAMAEGDRQLSAAIDRWQGRLAPLARLVPPVEAPPEIWDRLELATAPPLPNLTVLAPRPRSRAWGWGSVGLWRATTVGAMAMAAALAGIAVVRREAPPMYVADLAPTVIATGASPERLQRAADASLPQTVSTSGFLCASMHDGSIMVKPLAPMQVTTGKDLELWAVPPGAPNPVSLGVLPVGGMRVTASDMVQPETRLMVSLEPRGGSPTGQPTGPVLFAGTLARIE